MQYYYVKNWWRFQHYKHRNPPWVKLHTEIFTSEDWIALSDASRLLALASIVIASKHGGKVPADPQYIRRVAYLDAVPDFAPLISCGFLSKVLADASDCKQLRTNADTESRVQIENRFLKMEMGKQGRRNRDTG